MAILLSDTLDADSTSDDITVTPLTLVGIVTTAAITVVDVNDADGGESIALLSQYGKADSHPVLSSSGVIRIIVGAQAARVKVVQ